MSECCFDAALNPLMVSLSNHERSDPHRILPLSLRQAQGERHPPMSLVMSEYYSANAPCRVLGLGTVSYVRAWRWQRALMQARQEGRVPDLLLLLEHSPTYTLGLRGNAGNVLASAEELAALGAALHRVDRGGDVTFHGPGQLVGYPILHLKGPWQDIHAYLRALEDVLIGTLADYGIAAGRLPGHTGVWVDGNLKIAAIGVKISRWVTSHGFALNVNTDLCYFDRIVPCGLRGKAVTSMERLLGAPVELGDVARRLARRFGERFGLRMEGRRL